MIGSNTSSQREHWHVFECHKHSAESNKITTEKPIWAARPGYNSRWLRYESDCVFVCMCVGVKCVLLKGLRHLTNKRINFSFFASVRSFYLHLFSFLLLFPQSQDKTRYHLCALQLILQRFKPVSTGVACECLPVCRVSLICVHFPFPPIIVSGKDLSFTNEKEICSGTRDRRKE